MSQETIDDRRKRLIHRSLYTGMRETDILLGRFARAAVPQMDAAALDLYEALLSDVQDPMIYDWIAARSEPDEKFAPLIAQMRRFLDHDD